MIIQLLAAHARTRPTARWLSMLVGDELQTLTYGEAWHATNRAAMALRQLGVDETTRVALAPRNDFESVLSILGTLALGAHIWLVNPDDPESRIDRQLRARAPDVRLGALPSADRLAFVADDGWPVPSHKVPATAPALLFNTSGSTGVPKAVVQSYGAVVANARSFAAHHKLTPGRTVLGLLPVHHVNAVHSNLMSTLYAGAHCILLRPDSLLRLHRWIETTEPYLVSLVPTVAEALLSSWHKPRVPSSLHHVLSAAAPLSTRTVASFLGRFGRRIVQGYGLSETTNFSATVPIDLDDATYARVASEANVPSIGPAIADVQMCICDPGGEAVAEGTVGEICVRGPHLMTSYDGDEAATRDAFRDGWFRTGDLGFQANISGVGPMYYITGRSKNVAKIRGEQIAVEEVENALRASPAIDDAGCFIDVDSRDNERITAGVVTAGIDVSLEDLRKSLAALIPAFAIPGNIVVIDQVPRTPTGKILRDELANVIRNTQSPTQFR